MSVDAVELTNELVSIDSVSRHSNVSASDFLQVVLEGVGFEIERLEYDDAEGIRKVNLIGRRGSGSGGLSFFCHIDTVPGDHWRSDPFAAHVKDDRLTGLGSCDMKGPLAATVEAASMPAIDALSQPIYVVVTADEETSGRGALHVASKSKLYRDAPSLGVITEPTMLTPVYAHKGIGRAVVTAHGKSAHSSTGTGINATFLIAPFLADMTDLEKEIQGDESFLNDEFTPPHNCLNITIDDGRTRPNVTASRTVCTINFRTMPNDRSDYLLKVIQNCAEGHGLEFEGQCGQPFWVSPESRVVKIALSATGAGQAKTVGYGTDAFAFMNDLPLVILGPGNIAQAHTENEWISVRQLRQAVRVYGAMIDAVCRYPHGKR